MWLTAAAQDMTRELKLKAGDTIGVVNRSGRVSARAVAANDDLPLVSSVTASSGKGVFESEIKIARDGSRAFITVVPSDMDKRIDLVLIVPERVRIKVETAAGAIETAGNFALVEAVTETGTIAADVPADDLKYAFLWTESRPRYVADFDIEKVKEKSAGRFEIKGHRQSDGVKSKKEKVKSVDGIHEMAAAEPVETTGVEPAVDEKKPDQKKTKDEKAIAKAREKERRAREKEEREKAEKLAKARSRSVNLRFTTARGIMLLNVPPNEVASDLRERPLTNAAKAIIRSGDSLLMEAIRRSSPRHFGDYSRTLPPYSREPSFATKPTQAEVPGSQEMTAVVRVTDLNNRAVAGLRAADFEVIENGAPREILSVERSSAPFNLVLLLDVSGSVENYVNFIRKAARSFVNTVGQQDRVSIVIFNEDVKVLSTFTSDKGKLSESLDTFDAGGGTAYYDALAYAISDTLRPLKGERTAIVILTDGDDNRSFLAFDSLIGSIQESGALVYPLYVPSGLIAAAAQSGDMDPTRQKYMSLTAKSEGEGDRLAKVSGGVYYPIAQIDQIQKAYEDIVQQMRSAYNITYRSSGNSASTSGSSPRLRVRAKRENTFATVTSVFAAK